MNTKIKIAIADDEVLIRQGIKNLLLQENDFKIDFEASNGNELIDILTKVKRLPNIILMDINMPECNGVDATKLITAKYQSIKIIAVSSYTSDAFIKKMLTVGAVCYISKNFSTADLIFRIKKVHQNGFYYEQSFLKFINKNLKKDAQLNPHEISDREIEVLQLICDQKSSMEIADELQISPRTVDGHRNSLLAKTKSKNIVGLVVYAIQNDLYSPS